jgi:hypothetical protein
MFYHLMLNIYIHTLSLFQIVPFLADASSSTPDWVNYLLNGGPFAVVLLLIILDKLTTTGERDRLRTENEVLKKEIKDLNLSIRSEVVPPLVQLNALMKDVVGELSERKYHPPPRIRLAKE